MPAHGVPSGGLRACGRGGLTVQAMLDMSRCTLPAPAAPAAVALPPGVVAHVVISGGACSGKTSTVEAAAWLLRARGVRVAVAPEPASTVATHAVPDLASLERFDAAGYASAQAAMVRVAREQRLTLGRLVGELGGGVVLHDRGEFDAAAYPCRPGLVEVLAERGETLRDVACAYRLVFLCDGPPAGGYETESNPVRYEAVDVATARGEVIAQVWSAVRPDARRLPWEPVDPSLRARWVADAVLEATSAAT